MKSWVRWTFPNTCNSLGKMILTVDAHFECTLLISDPPQLHKNITIFILPTIIEKIAYIMYRTPNTHHGLFQGKNITRGNKQLKKVDVDWSRGQSVVIMHTECVTGVHKQKLTILQEVIPISSLYTLKAPTPQLINSARICPSVASREWFNSTVSLYSSYI